MVTPECIAPESSRPLFCVLNSCSQTACCSSCILQFAPLLAFLIHFLAVFILLSRPCQKPRITSLSSLLTVPNGLLSLLRTACYISQKSTSLYLHWHHAVQATITFLPSNTFSNQRLANSELTKVFTFFLWVKNQKNIIVTHGSYMKFKFQCLYPKF